MKDPRFDKLAELVLDCDLRAESEVYADGELVYRDGHFLDG
jgi:hypothetical protein